MGTYDDLLPQPSPARATSQSTYSDLIPDPNRPTMSGSSKAFATGVRQGAEGSVGAVGDAPGMVADSTAFVLKKLGFDDKEAEDAGRRAQQSIPDPLRPTLLLKALQLAGVITPEQAAKIGSPTTETVAKTTDAAVKQLPESVSGPVQDVTRHIPVNQQERTMQTAGNFASGALLPGGPVARVARVAGPTVATEGAGKLAEAVAPDWEPAARMLAGFLSGTGVGKVENSFRVRRAAAQVGTTPAAAAKVKQLLVDQGMAPEDAQARMRELGLEATVADTGPNTRQAAQQIQARGGKGRGTIDPLLRQREEASGPRLEADVTATVGPEKQKSDVISALEQRMKAGGAKQEIAHPGQTAAIDLQPALDQIDAVIADTKTDAVRSALQQARKTLFGKVPQKPGDPGWVDPPVNDPNFKQQAPLETDSQRVLRARQAIGAMLYDDKTGLPLKGAEIPHLNEVYAEINKAIDPANPELRAADAEISQAGKEKDAFGKGQRIYENAREDPSSVEFARDYGPLSEGEKAHIGAGANVETWRQVNTTGRERAKLQGTVQGEGKANFEKLATTFGRDKAQQLLNALEREKVFNETYNKVVQGSKTAETQGGGGGILSDVAGAVPEVAAATLVGGPGAGFGAGLANARRIIGDKLSSMGQPGRDADVARLLMSQDPDQVVQAAQALKAGKPVLPRAMLAALMARQSGQ